MDSSRSSDVTNLLCACAICSIEASIDSVGCGDNGSIICSVDTGFR